MSIPGNINQLLIGAASSTGGDAGPIKSVRFDKTDSSYLNKTFSDTGNQKTFTISFWIKKCLETTSQYLFTTEFVTGDGYFEFTSNADQLQVYNTGSSSVNVKLERLFRDPSSWHHLVLAIDTTQSAQSDRLKIYLNGEHITDYASGSSVFPSQNDVIDLPAYKDRLIGAAEFNGSLQGYYDGYMADFYFIDGQALDPTSFGETDTNGVWQPITADASLLKPSVTEGTGALSLYNLGQSLTAKASPVTFRTDPYASNLQTAVAGDNSNEVSYLIRGSGSALTLTNTSVTFNQPGKYYSDAYLIQTAGAACEVAETSGNKPGTSDFCVEFWIHPTTTPANSGLFSYGDYNTAGSFGIMTTGSNSLRVDMNDGYAQTGSALTVAGGLQANEWQHFALTRAGTTCTLYRNGTSQGTWTINAAADFTPASNPRYVIGNRLGLTFGSYNITSYFQDFRVYVGTEKYSGNFTLSTQTGGNSFHLFDFANESGIGDDSSGNENDWTPNNLSSATGGPTSVAAATGGLPIHETTDTYGRTIGSGLRADANASYLELAAPFTTSGSNALTDDESPSGRTSSTKTLASSGTITSDSSDYHFSGSSASFGASAYSRTSDSAFNFGTSDFTIEFFVKQPSGDSGSLIATNLSSAATTSFNSRFYGSSGTIDVYTSGSTEYISISGNTVGEWVHIAFVRSNASTMKVFVNGALKATNNNWTMSLTDSGNFYVNTGRDGQSARHWQDLRVYKGLAKYSTTFNPPTQTQDALTASANAVLRDVPTNGTQTDTGVGGEVSGNYATWNPLFGENQTIENGNLVAKCSSAGNYAIIASTLSMTSGKYYMEYTYDKNGGNFITFGVSQTNRDGKEGSGVTDTAEDFGFKCWDSGFYAQSNGVNQYNYSDSVSDGDILSLAFDADEGKLWVAKNGTWMTNASGTGDPANGSNPDYSSLTYSGGYLFMAGPYVDGVTNILIGNFGQRGWAYEAPSGFKALCTTNQSTPSIVKGSTAQNTDIWTGNSSTRTISGLDFGPEWVWIKTRNQNAINSIEYDYMRGPGYYLYPTDTNTENYNASNGLTAFNSDGYDLNDPGGWSVNTTGHTYVGYSWDAGTPPTRTHTQPAYYSSTTLYTTAADVVANATPRSAGDAISSEYIYIVTNSGGRIGQKLFDTTGSLPSTWYLLMYQNSAWESYGSYNNSTDVPLFKWKQVFDNTFMTYTIANDVELNIISNGTSPALVSATLPTLFTTTDDGAVVNTDGDITSRVRANPSVGFSIVMWTSIPWTGSAVNRQVGHGLGAAPAFIITKGTENAASWYCYHKDLDASNPEDWYILLNDNSARGNLADSWGPNQPDTTTFGDRILGWSDNQTAIAYCFTRVEGFSDFGSYVGTGTDDGAFVFTGFQVKYLLTKAATAGSDWQVWDTTREPNNPNANTWAPNTTGQESGTSGYKVDLVSNGFKFRMYGSSSNAASVTYIWAAFAAHPTQLNGGLGR